MACLSVVRRQPARACACSYGEPTWVSKSIRFVVVLMTQYIPKLTMCRIELFCYATQVNLLSVLVRSTTYILQYVWLDFDFLSGHICTPESGTTEVILHVYRRITYVILCTYEYKCSTVVLYLRALLGLWFIFVTKSTTVVQEEENIIKIKHFVRRSRPPGL